jgi:hypothetical protein
MAPSLGSINLLTEFLGLLAYYKRYRGIPEEEMIKQDMWGVEAKLPFPLCAYHPASTSSCSAT